MKLIWYCKYLLYYLQNKRCFRRPYKTKKTARKNSVKKKEKNVWLPLKKRLIP